jgi:PAS domain S-box-containing protein
VTEPSTTTSRAATEAFALQAILENTDDRIWVVDRDYRLVLSNAAFDAHVQVTMGRSLLPGDSMVPDDVDDDIRTLWCGLFDRALAGECFTHVRTTLKTPEPRIAEYRLNPVRDESGAVTGAVVRARDITEQQRALEARAADERRHLAFLDATDDILLLKDSRFRNVVANRRATEYFGLPKSEIVGKSDDELMGPEAARGCRLSDLAALEAGGVCQSEEQVGDRVFETRKFPVPFDDGSVGVGAIIRDVSDIRAAETERRRSVQMFKDMAEQVVDVLYTLDLQGTFTYVSPSCTTLFGYAPEEIIGRPFTEFVAPETVGQAVGMFWDVLATGTTLRNLRVTVVRANGDHASTDLSGAPLRQDGRLVGCIGTLRDVTDIVRANAEARQRHKLEALGTLAAGIAHDFNNILQGIQGLAEELGHQSRPSDPCAGTVGSIRAACARAAALIERILAYVSGTPRPKVAQQLQPVISETIQLFSASIPRTVRIEGRISPECKPVLADPAQVREAVLSLCANACEAMAEAPAGVLSVALEPVRLDERHAKRLLPLAVAGTEAALRPGEYTRLTVADTGVGIPADLVERIFDPYFGTRKGRDGSGLGLTTVVGAAAAHNAALLLQTSVGSGSTFSVHFTVTEAPAPGPAATMPTPSGASEVQGSERVLVVDDEEVITKVLRASLGRLGYSVTTYTNPLDALESVRRNPDAYDVVVTDLAMVEMSGLDLAAEIREVRSGLPVLLCTGYTEFDDHARATEIGIHAVLKKPLPTRALAGAIRAALAEGPKHG